MSKVYTTKELIQILADERQACLMGKRLKLGVTDSGNPVIDPLIRTNALQKFSAYQDFRDTIHDYQRKHLVSGIVWREVTVKAKTLHYPEVDSQLIALPSDLDILKDTKKSLVEFWYGVTSGMDLYLSFNNGKQHQQIIIPDVERISQRTEWASLCKWENSNFLEIILQLAWGKPEEASYKRGFPSSGSEYIHAVNPGHRPIG
ncbi:MAG: hypothetical protein DSM106950_23875 [Stigonema ocellatum SAG 48.90 = DSM 106950]|nr:hypothetical protein [Stigonema ocellatum SAG 48.90 = DSM 106950]